jgi:protein tyrosine/serine phosphatase
VDRRHVSLEGSLNLRDLGGYESGDGRLVRTGCLYRSDELHALTNADLEAVGALGIRVVFDLRNAEERAARPNRLPLDVELLERAADAPARPLRFHCAAGKDRTGIASAVLLGVLGVSDERIRPLLEARRPVLATVLRHVHERWGGFEGFAHNHLAVEADLPERLRAALLTRSG